jgi:predicted dehydrogenase
MWLLSLPNHNLKEGIVSRLPKPHLFKASDSKPLRWGVFGAGWISDQMLTTVNKNSNQKFLAVASRTPGKAESFAAKHNIPSSHNSYEELAAREDIDAIYIGTLPSDRLEVALIAINAGKHVLIEKPITMDVSEAEQIYAAAKAKNLLAVEAMWTRFLPQMDIARQLMNDGVLGNIELVVSTFCQANLGHPRLYSIGGGNPIIDMGIYPIALSQQFLGDPDEIHAFGVLHPNQIDEEASVFMKFKNGSRSTFVNSARTALPNWAGVSGDKATLSFGHPWFTPTSITLHTTDFSDKGETWTDDFGMPMHLGLVHQVHAFAQYVDQGLLEAPLYTHKDSIGNITTALKIGELIGARFK